jgi:hypothetical protein
MRLFGISSPRGKESQNIRLHTMVATIRERPLFHLPGECARYVGKNTSSQSQRHSSTNFRRRLEQLFGGVSCLRAPTQSQLEKIYSY